MFKNGFVCFGEVINGPWVLIICGSPYFCLRFSLSSTTVWKPLVLSITNCIETETYALLHASLWEEPVRKVTVKNLSKQGSWKRHPFYPCFHSSYFRLHNLEQLCFQ
ncbi:hypothetical protein Ddye_001054 [Dipteronia dyeriana]|uniref:Uncharacterized protein n=1 Tax=Dipteronia dyeriana TaxID=168575 RepID=A0AAD9XNI8_9ROSI|nr:hypothetical protein Ddye_001054 [Dipteronia dyeriana]